MYANPIICTTFIYADYLYYNLIGSSILNADPFLSIGSVFFFVSWKTMLSYHFAKKRFIFYLSGLKLNCFIYNHITFLFNLKQNNYWNLFSLLKLVFLFDIKNVFKMTCLINLCSIAHRAWYMYLECILNLYTISVT